MKTIQPYSILSLLTATSLKRSGFPLIALAMAFPGGLQEAWATPAATATTLTVSADGIPVTTVAWGSVVTLTATVKKGSAPITVGQVKFCDASAKYCTDIHQLGAAQLTSAETATMSFVPPIGSHSYKAVFTGTKSDGTSTSSTAILKVLGPYPTISTIEVSGRAGNYELETTVTGTGATVPTGTVAYLDTSNEYALLGTAELEEGTTEPLTFLQSSLLQAEGGSLFVAVGDFNGDGIPDLAVTNIDGNTVTIGLGNGDGTFTKVASSPDTGAFPIFIAVGDFNRDGIPDLAVLNNVNGGMGSVTVLLGNGDGTFTATPASPSTGDNPNSIAVADFNGDGIPDLAVANAGISQGHGTVTVLLGKGNGTFTAASTSPSVSGNPSFVAEGDFNGDGIPDLAVACQANGDAGTVKVLLGKGDGTFTPVSVSTVVGVNPQSIAVADFNGDGKADLAVVNGGESNGSGTLTLLLGKGNGTFTSATVGLTPGQQYNSIAAGDFNGDGIPDLAVSASGAVGEVTVLRGNGAGKFTSLAAAPSVGDYPSSIAAADLNGDGKADLVSGEGVLLAQRVQIARALSDEIAPIGTSAPHSVVAVYSGDSNNAPSTSPTVALLGEMLTPAVSLKSSASSVVTGGAVTLTCKVTGALTVTGNLTMPTGAVAFYSGTVPLATVALNGSGVSSYSTSALSLGEHILTTVYLGDGNYVSAVSAAITLMVTPKPAAKVTLKSSSASVVSGRPVTFTAAAAGNLAKPTGTVTFHSGKTLLGTVDLNGNGAAMWSTTKLAIGKNSITASYAGNRYYAPVTSTPVIVAVSAP